MRRAALGLREGLSERRDSAATSRAHLGRRHPALTIRQQNVPALAGVRFTRAVPMGDTADLHGAGWPEGENTVARNSPWATPSFPKRLDTLCAQPPYHTRWGRVELQRARVMRPTQW